MRTGAGMQRLVGVAVLVLASLVAASPSSSTSGADRAAAIEPWPGGQAARAVDVQEELGTDVSGLSYRTGATAAADVLWGVGDRAGLIHRLVQRSGRWRPDTADSWGEGKTFTFPDGRRPDAEGLVVQGSVAWVSTERDDTGVSRLSILRVPLSGTGATLGPTREWSLKDDFPPLGANAGLESLDFVPNSFLVAHGFVDEARGAVYAPSAHPGQVGDGVFFVAAESAVTKGEVRGYVLKDDGTAVRVATITNPLGHVRALDFDASTGRLWIVCDDDCDGRITTAQIRGGRFVASTVYARPTALPNRNNEGFTVAPASRCANGSRPVFWSNDSNNAGHAIWAGTLPCSSTEEKVVPTLAVKAPRVQAGRKAVVTVRATASSGGVVRGRVAVDVGRRSRTAQLSQGVARVSFGTFRRPGLRKVKVSYAGSSVHAAKVTTSRLRVTRARVTRASTRPALPGPAAVYRGSATTTPARSVVSVRVG